MHLHRNQGCPNCLVKAIYTDQYYEAHNIPDHKVMLYLVSFKSEDEEFLKIGITKHENIKYRFRGYTDYTITVLLGLSLMFSQAFPVEQEILRKYANSKYLPLRKFKGHTEALNYSEKDKIMSSVLETVQEKLL